MNILRFSKPEYAARMRQEFSVRLNRQMPLYSEPAILAGIEKAMDSWRHGASDDNAFCDGVDAAMAVEIMAHESTTEAA